MFTFYCKLFVVYLLLTTVTCYADVESIECINFENESYCYDAGYMTVKGSNFDFSKFKDVFKVDNENMLYFLIDQTVSNSSYIYAQFAYDKAAVPQGPHLVSFRKNSWVKFDFTVSVLYGGFYNSDLPVWTDDTSSSIFYITGQSTNLISNSTVLEVSGWFYSWIHDHEFHFYCTEPGYKGLMPRCALVASATWSLKCTITDAIPTNYTFRYVVKQEDADWYMRNTVMLSELHIV